MPKAYVILTERVHDDDGYREYMERSAAPARQYRARPLVVDDAPEVLEGTWHGPRTVVMEFESVDAARAWYRSPEYQAVIGLRHAAVETNAVLVAGFEMPAQG